MVGAEGKAVVVITNDRRECGDLIVLPLRHEISTLRSHGQVSEVFMNCSGKETIKLLLCSYLSSPEYFDLLFLEGIFQKYLFFLIQGCPFQG